MRRLDVVEVGLLGALLFGQAAEAKHLETSRRAIIADRMLQGDLTQGDPTQGDLAPSNLAPSNLAPSNLAQGDLAQNNFVQNELAQNRMAQNDVGQEPVPGRDVLAAGAGAAADGKSRTVFTIELGAQPLPARPKLELLLTPSTVVPKEPYLIAISLADGAESDAKRLGVVSFFPARAGITQSFFIDASPIAAEMKAKGTTRINLALSLVAAERGQTLTASAVRLVGARIVGN
jgi:hypothetical protein